jgi:hypothetical protein
MFIWPQMGITAWLCPGAQECQRGTSTLQPGHLGLQAEPGGDGPTGRAGPQHRGPEHHGWLAQRARPRLLLNQPVFTLTLVTSSSGAEVSLRYVYEFLITV